MNLSMILDMAADGFGDGVVFGSRLDGLTADRLRSLAIGGAALLRENRVSSLVYLNVAGQAFEVALFASAYAGVPLIPLNYRLGEDQLGALLAKHPAALVIADQRHMELARRAGTSVISPARWLETAGVRASESAAELSASDSPAAVIYTSGSTSQPKGVELAHENLLAYVLGTVEFAGADPEEATLTAVPPYHIAGVSNALTNLYAGRRVVTLDSFSPRGWLDTVRQEDITNAMVVPTMLARIMDSEADLSVPTLRTLSYGGARMPASVIEQALRAWPHIDFVNGYGLTETSSTITILRPEDHRAALARGDTRARDRLASVGQPLPGVEVEIRDGDGRTVPAGTSGLVWVRSAQVSGRYSGLGSSLDERGFFCTRDEGRIDSDGFLFLDGRADDTIIRGGENIAPAEIEAVILGHPAVGDAVVVGVPDETWGQRIEAVAVPRPGSDLTSESLREYVRERIRSSKTPDRIVLWDELPRTEVGKLVRRDIVARLATESRDG